MSCLYASVKAGVYSSEVSGARFVSTIQLQYTQCSLKQRGLTQQWELYCSGFCCSDTSPETAPRQQTGYLHVAYKYVQQIRTAARPAEHSDRRHGPPPRSTPCRTSAMDDPAAAGGSAQARFIRLLTEAAAWAQELVMRHLDARSRLALYQSSVDLQEWIQDIWDHCTVVLHGYQDMEHWNWSRRLARAEDELQDVTRPCARLVLQLPTPNREALDSVASLSRAAGVAVTELSVQLGHSSETAYHGVRSVWLFAVPTTYPNLRALRVSRLCGLLPCPSVLPHLRELDVVLVILATADVPGCPAR